MVVEDWLPACWVRQMSIQCLETLSRGSVPTHGTTVPLSMVWIESFPKSVIIYQWFTKDLSELSQWFAKGLPELKPIISHWFTSDVPETSQWFTDDFPMFFPNDLPLIDQWPTTVLLYHWFRSDLPMISPTNDLKPMMYHRFLSELLMISQWFTAISKAMMSRLQVGAMLRQLGQGLRHLQHTSDLVAGGGWFHGDSSKFSW